MLGCSLYHRGSDEDIVIEFGLTWPVRESIPGHRQRSANSWHPSGQEVSSGEFGIATGWAHTRFDCEIDAGKLNSLTCSTCQNVDTEKERLISASGPGFFPLQVRDTLTADGFTIALHEKA